MKLSLNVELIDTYIFFNILNLLILVIDNIEPS